MSDPRPHCPYCGMEAVPSASVAGEKKFQCKNFYCRNYMKAFVRPETRQ